MLFKNLKRRKKNPPENSISPGSTKSELDEKSLYYEEIANSLKLIDLEKELQSGLESAIVYRSRD